jgi:glycosyltransferase 2 family protein
MRNQSGIIRRHKWEILISLVIGAFIIFFISLIVGLKDIVNVLRQTNLILIPLIIALQFIIFVAWTLRWRLILNVIDRSPKFWRLLALLFTSVFGNNITPGSAGGEPLRAYILNKIEGTPFEIGLASATADRVFEFFPVVVLSILGVFLIFTWNIPFWTSLIASVIIIITLIFFCLLIYIMINKEIAERVIISLARMMYPLLKRLTRSDASFSYVSRKLKFYIDRFTTGFLEVWKNHRMFLYGLIISFGMWGVDLTRMYLCFVAIGSYPPILPMIIIYTITVLISILPTLPAALGIGEATMVALFLVVGVPADVVIAASLINRLVSYVIPTILGGFAAAYYGNKFKNENSNDIEL